MKENIQVDFELKASLGNKLLQEPSALLDSFAKVVCEINGILFEFKCFSEEAESFLVESLPSGWIVADEFNKTANPIRVKWYTPASIGYPAELAWDIESNPNLKEVKGPGHGHIVAQRDFLAVYNSKNEFTVVSDPANSDGIFNFLRWVMPVELLRQNAILFHSSGILRNNKAILFTGPSGTGKTTISSFFDSENRLGDDMNIIRFSDEKLWAEPAFVGQEYCNKDLYGQQFELEQVFWLQKDSINQISELPSHSRRSKLLSSFANFPWQTLTANENSQLFAFLSLLASKANFRQLNFNLNGDIKDEIAE